MGKQSLKDLSENEILRGISLVLDNAEDLMFEAFFLMENNRIARSYTLTQLAIEEVGKSGILVGILLSIRQKRHLDWDEIDKIYFSHSGKATISIAFQLVFEMLYRKHGIPDRNNYFKKLYAKKVANVNTQNINKNDSLYVGVRCNKFFSPKDVITEQMVDSLQEELFNKYVGTKALFNEIFNGLAPKDTLEQIEKKISRHTELNIDYKKINFGDK